MNQPATPTQPPSCRIVQNLQQMLSPGADLSIHLPSLISRIENCRQCPAVENCAILQQDPTRVLQSILSIISWTEALTAGRPAQPVIEANDPSQTVAAQINNLALRQLNHNPIMSGNLALLRKLAQPPEARPAEPDL